MHAPAPFRDEELSSPQATVEAVANLVTCGADGPVATPLPLVLDARDGPMGRLHSDVARANLQWRGADGARAPAIFMGPDACVTPPLYATKARDRAVAPLVPR